MHLHWWWLRWKKFKRDVKVMLFRASDVILSFVTVNSFEKTSILTCAKPILILNATMQAKGWNTHKRLNRMKLITYGVASGLDIWQRTTEQIYSVFWMIFVTGRTDDENLQNFENVLSILSKLDWNNNNDKYEFLKDKIIYYGHYIDGLFKQNCKIEYVWGKRTTAQNKY